VYVFTGFGKVEELERFKNKKTAVNLKVKDGKGKETGEINVEIELESKIQKAGGGKEEEEKQTELRKKREEVRARAIKEMAIEREKASKSISDSALNIRVIDAKFYEKQDVFGAGDPYVIVKFSNKRFRTKTYNNTKTATYNEGLLIKVVYLFD
jgi:hypothetical protein